MIRSKTRSTDNRVCREQKATTIKGIDRQARRIGSGSRNELIAEAVPAGSLFNNSISLARLVRAMNPPVHHFFCITRPQLHTGGEGYPVR